jgi:hypothetical protein
MMSTTTELCEISKSARMILRASPMSNLRNGGSPARRCGAALPKGVELMQDYTERDRVRPIAEHTGDGPDDWQVVIVGYSGLSDPLMQDESKGSP